MVDKRIEFLESVYINSISNPPALPAQPSPALIISYSTLKQSDNNEISGPRIQHFTTVILSIWKENLSNTIPVFPPF